MYRVKIYRIENVPYLDCTKFSVYNLANKFRFQFSLNPIDSAYSDSDCTSLMWEHIGVVLIDYGSASSEGPKNEVCCPAGGPAPRPVSPLMSEFGPI